MQNLGYTKPLFILAFDHRSTLEKTGFQNIPQLKQIIYEAFKKSIGIIPPESAAILVDEQYGNLILKDAQQNSYNTVITIEKSGQEDFLFEYGEEFGQHIEKYNPQFAKVNFKIKNEISDLSKNNLRKLSDYCHSHSVKFLLELISGGNVNLILKTIVELQDFGIEPDVWKIEGMEDDLDYQSIIEEIKKDGRDNVSMVILGRGESKELVEKWIKTGSKMLGIIGFAIGRTIFWEPLNMFRDAKITREEAVNKISENYKYFYNLFVNGQTN